MWELSLKDSQAYGIWSRKRRTVCLPGTMDVEDAIILDLIKKSLRSLELIR